MEPNNFNTGARIISHGLVKLSIFLLVVAAFWYVAVYSRSVNPQGVISVSAESKVVAVPDVAEVTFGVLTEGGKNLSDLQRENSERVNRVVVFLKGNGIDDKDIKTQHYNITPRYQYFSCPAARSSPERSELISCPPPEIVGYTINQSTLVKVRDLNRAGSVISGVVERGTNSVSGLSFVVDDPTVFQNQARAEAIAKAKEKAVAIAKAGGFRLGKIISFDEGATNPYFDQFNARQAGFALSGDAIAPLPAPAIEPGSREIRVIVNLIYQIRL